MVRFMINMNPNYYGQIHDKHESQLLWSDSVRNMINMNPNYYGQILFPKKTAKFAATSCPPSKSLMQAQGVEGGRASSKDASAPSKTVFLPCRNCDFIQNPMPPLQSSHNLDYTKYTA
jgi:hypothetical protein